MEKYIKIELIRDLLYEELKREYPNSEDRAEANYYMVKTMMVLLKEGLPVGNKKYSQLLRILANTYYLLPESEQK